jgi:hypothetical protein
MGYLRGDYLRGDGHYMRGDPGIFGDIWGGIKGAVGGFVSGGPLGAIGGALRGSGIIKPSAPRQLQAPGQLPPIMAPTSTTSIGPGGSVFKRTEYGVQTQGMPAMGAACEDGCPKGYHLNKSSYFTREGFVAAGTKCVKNRRMNVVNPKALRRGIRRAKGAVKLLKKSAGSMGYSVVAKRAPKMRKR